MEHFSVSLRLKETKLFQAVRPLAACSRARVDKIDGQTWES